MATLKKQIFKHIYVIFFILLGTFIMGSAYNIFYASSGILLGGFGGIASIIAHYLSMVNVNLPVSAIYLILNVILYIFAVKTLGKKFGFYALVGILGYSLFLEVCKFPSISDDLLLNSIYGGVLTGIGTGIVIRSGASTGGGDMLGCIITHKNPKISIGWVTICVNAVVIITGIFVFGLNLTLYALIAIFISGKTGDIFIEGPKSVKAFYIISSNPEKLAATLISDLHRGVTSFEAYGKYSGNKLEVIMCLISSHQIQKLKEIVYNLDPNAFMFSVSVKEAMGKGFNKLESKKSIIMKKSKLTPAILDKNISSNPENITQQPQTTTEHND